MRKLIKIAAVLAAAAALIALTVFSFKADSGKMLGVVVAEGGAIIEVADQPGERERILVDRVVAPDDSWVVVHNTADEGMPGPKVGITRVGKGESRDVAVELERDVELTPDLLVVMHADRGVRDRFEFDMEYFDKSPDKPYFIDGMKLAKTITINQ